MTKNMAIILAAGEGTRMRSATPKMLHKVCGRTLVEWSLSAASAADEKPVVVLGFGRERVASQIEGRARFCVQEEQLGTGHALICAREYLENFDGTVLVMAGDMPLIRRETVGKLLELRTPDVSCAMLTAIAEDPTGYGRVLRDEAGGVSGIVEQRDATAEQQRIREVNSSVYAFDGRLLWAKLQLLTNDNAQKQYYLTDVIHMLIRDGEKVRTVCLPDLEECCGINDRVQLAQAEKQMRRRINEAHMRDGVTLIDPDATYIDADVTIGQDAVIYPGNILTGDTFVGAGTTLYGYNRLVNAHVGENCRVESSLLEDCRVGDRVTIGPGAHLRPGADLANDVRVGNFVEIKNANVGEGTKVSHLTYIGDADVGAGVNVGCGVVFCNYDGKRKHRSVVEDGVFLGCNTNLVAPVTVGKDAYTAAGTTVTTDVEPGALCVGRVRQTDIPGWVKKHKER